VRVNGYTIYNGPSLLDGSPIVALITGFAIPTANPKMGKEPLQSWILRSDVTPIESVKTGADAAICGACPHRGHIEDGRNLGRSCYVQYHFGVQNTWLAWKRGNYPERARPIDIADLGFARMVRIGSYGDPAAVPFWVWRTVASGAAWTMGYTHAWRTCDEKLKQLCMASVESEAERQEAKAAGWRTFRVRHAHEPVGDYEIVCPASTEAGKVATCEECRA